MIKRLATLAASLALVLGPQFTAQAQAKKEIIWWHAMSGALNDWVNDVAADFNKRQSEYVVVPVFKGVDSPVKATTLK